MTELAPLPDYPNSAAYAINDSGQAAGVSAEVFGPGHASLWQDGVVQDLGTLPGYPDSVGRGFQARSSYLIGSCSVCMRVSSNGTCQGYGPRPSGW